MKALAVALLVSVLCGASAQNAFAQKHLDRFFDDHLKDSGCEQAAWEEMRQTMHRTFTKEAPPSVGSGEDLNIVNKVAACSIIADNKYNKIITQLADAFRSDLASNEVKTVLSNFFNSSSINEVNTYQDVVKLIVKLSNIQKANSELVDQLYVVILTRSFTIDTIHEHVEHISDGKYHDLVSRYNSLVDAMAEVRRNVRPVQGYTMPQQPQTLHCDIETMKYDTSITTMDCR